MNLTTAAHHALVQAAQPAAALLTFALPAMVVLLWTVVMYTAGRRCARPAWRRQVPLALLAGLLAGTAAWLLLPPGPTPGLAEFGYALPPERLVQGAVAVGLVAAAFAWPLLVLRHGLPTSRAGLAT